MPFNLHPRHRPFAVWLVAMVVLHLVMWQTFWVQAMVAFFGTMTRNQYVALNFCVAAAVTAAVIRPIWNFKRFALWMAAAAIWLVICRTSSLGSLIYYSGAIAVGAAFWLTAPPRLGYWMRLGGAGSAFMEVPRQLHLALSAPGLLSVQNHQPEGGASASAQITLATLQVDLREEQAMQTWRDVRSHTMTGTAYTNDGQVVPVSGTGYTDHGPKSAVLPTGNMTVTLTGQNPSGKTESVQVCRVPIKTAHVLRDRFIGPIKSQAPAAGGQ